MPVHILALVFLLISLCNAQTQPNITVTKSSSSNNLYFSIAPSTVSPSPWTNIRNASCDIAGAATSQVEQDKISHNIQILNWNFNLPKFIIIKRIIVNFTRFADVRNIYDETIGLLTNGTAAQPPVLTIAVPAAWPSPDMNIPPTAIFYPRPQFDPLWSFQNWTSDIINSPNFGVSIRVQRAYNAGMFYGLAQLICVEVSVTYDLILCPNNCSFPSGTCLSDGTCQCDSTHSGEDCSTLDIMTSGEVTTSELTSFELTSGQLTTSPLTTSEVRVTRPLSSTGDSIESSEEVASTKGNHLAAIAIGSIVGGAFTIFLVVMAIMYFMKKKLPRKFKEMELEDEEQ